MKIRAAGSRPFELDHIYLPYCSSLTAPFAGASRGALLARFAAMPFLKPFNVLGQ